MVAHNNLRMRGQAFVSFASADVAQKALKEVRGFPLYSKPMVRTLSRILTPIHTSEHALPANLFRKNSLRRGREAARRGTLRGASTAETETQRCVSVPGFCRACSRMLLLHIGATRYTNPLKQKFRAKRLATESGLYVTPRVALLLYLSHSCNRSRRPCSRCSQATCSPDA